MQPVIRDQPTIREVTAEDLDSRSEVERYLEHDEYERSEWSDWEEGVEEEEKADAEEEEEYEEDEHEEEEEEAEVEKERGQDDKFDIFQVFMMLQDARRARQSAVVEDAKKSKMHLMTALKTQAKKKKPDDDKASQGTLITPEEVDSVREDASSESSIHPCFRDIDISDSRLKLQNLFTWYPVPDDPGLAPAYWKIDATPVIDIEDPVQRFLELARSVGVRPIATLEKMLDTEILDLAYYGVDPRLFGPICETLRDNSSIVIVDLKDNWLTTGACRHLSNLLSRNQTIRRLTLSGCRIGPEGARKLQDGLSESASLVRLDLDACDLGDRGLACVADAISENENIEIVNLANNRLSEAGAVDLCRMIHGATSLRELDLSWNSLFTAETWKALLRTLLNNDTLGKLNLSWNALSKECVRHLCRLLTLSLGLQELDMSGNRFTEKDAVAIARALSRNVSLRTVRLGDNPLKAHGALALVRALTPQKAPGSNLRLLDLENVWADKSVLPELEAIENEKPWLEVKLGGVLGNFRLIGPDARKIFLKRANIEAMSPKRKRMRRNFGHFVLSLTDVPVSQNRFRALVKQFKLRLSSTLVDAIMSAFVGPKNTVDQGQLKSFYLGEYPDTKAPPVKPKKRNEKKEEERAGELARREEVKRERRVKKRSVSFVQSAHEDFEEGEAYDYEE